MSGISKKLTDDQCQMLDFIRNRRQALIQGCAGSGKTIVEYRLAIEEKSKPEGCFYIFINPDEYLYNTGIKLLIKNDPFVLMDNCWE